MSLFSEEHIEKIKNYDFFGTEGPLYNDTKSVIAWGSFKDNPPLVSILLTTYRRPEMLKLALQSAINQKDFDDYEIIVIDNECAPLEEDTATQKVIKEINNDKVIYFRNQVSCYFRMNMAPSLSKSKFFCYMHDDDTINPYHLKVMTKIMDAHPEIDFLACRNKPCTVREIELLDKDQKGLENNYVCRKVHLEETVFLDNYTWLGALIKKEKFYEIGGVVTMPMGMGDTVFVSKATYLLNRYYIHFPGYNYLHNDEQASSDKNAWINCFYTNYFFSCYVLKKIYGKCTESMKEMVKEKMVVELDKIAKERNFDIDYSSYFNAIGVAYDIKNPTVVELNKKRIKGWEEYLLRLREIGDRFSVCIKEENGLRIDVGE